MGDVDVEAIHRKKGFAIMTGGDWAAVDAWLDADGDISNADDAVVAIVEYEGRWFCVDLRCFEPVFSH